MYNQLRSRLKPLLVFALLLSGCAPTLTEVKTDALAIPQVFPEHQTSATPLASMKTWQEFFQDPKLKALIETGLHKNQELRILEQEIHIADNEVMSRQGEYMPKVGIEGRGGLEKPGHYTGQGLSDEANGVPDPTPEARLGLTATWELDIWKKLRNSSRAAYFHYLSTIEGRRFAVTQWVSEMANTYFELLTLDNQKQAVDSYVELLKKITAMVRLQKNAARVTSLPVKRFEAELLKNEVRQVELKQQIVVTQNRINTLAGRFPGPVDRDSNSLMGLELAQIDAGVPSSRLEQRPDVKAAALEIESTKLSLAAAKARFYPALTIDARTGLESFNTSHLLETPASLFYGVAGGITAPLLNRSAIKADYFSANNKQIQAVYHYEQTLLYAFTDVVNQMSLIKNLHDAYDFRSKQVAAMEEAAQVSSLLFQAARVDYIETLLTQREALEARIEMIESKKNLLGAYVNLYRALGGGWQG